MPKSTEEVNSSVTIDDRYAELFAAAVEAAKEAGWGIPQSHDELMTALACMAIPSSN